MSSVFAISARKEQVGVALRVYLPLGGRYGYIVGYRSGSEAEYYRTLAHELGHGVFNLRHTFSPENPHQQPRGATDNLMEYPSTGSGQAPSTGSGQALSTSSGQAPSTGSGQAGTALYKYQWDLIHDPEKVWFAWAEREEEGELKKLKGTYTIWVGDSVVRDKKILINNNNKNKIYVKYEPIAGDTGTFIYSKVVYRPQWSKEDKSWPVTTWGKINVNTKTYFPLDSLPEGRYMVLFKNKNEQVDTVKFYLRNKKYDFACEICGRDLSLTFVKLKLIFPENDKITQAHVDHLNAALKKGGFSTCKRHAHFFSQISIESKNFTDFEEDYWYRLLTIYEKFGNQSNDSYKTLYSQDFWDKNEHLDYTGSSLCAHLYQKKDTCTNISDKNKRYIGVGSITKTRNGYTVTFPESFKKDTTGTYIKYTITDSKKCGENLFNLVYKDKNGNTQAGDGWKYRGREAIQVTGRANYKKVSDKCNSTFGKSFDWENDPDQLNTDTESIIYSAVAWFLNAFNPISTLDNKTSNQVTGIVNTKKEKAAEREQKFNELMNDSQLYNCESK